MDAEPLDRKQILRYLEEVAEILGERGESQVIVVVGGALLAYYGLRETTTDVDSVRSIGEELAAAAVTVAKRHNLRPDWLNTGAVSWRPATLDESQCDLMLERGRLRVLAAPIDQVFLMKLDSYRSTDHEDLVIAWPATSFQTADEVVAAFWEAFPGAAPDDGLGGLVEQVIKEAETRSQLDPEQR